MNAEIIETLNHRYAVQTFDAVKKISSKDLHTILESARLAPSSVGLEAWKFIVVENTELRAQIRKAGFDQAKITDASYLILLTYRTDHENVSRERLERTAKTQNVEIESLAGLKRMTEETIASKVAIGEYENWVKAQTYIALGIMIETASLLHIDTGPMEGFDAEKVGALLHLPEKNLKVATMLALGYRGKDPVAQRPKTRRDFTDVIEYI